MRRSLPVFALVLAAATAAASAGAEDAGYPRPAYAPKPEAVAGVANPVLPLDGSWAFNPAPPAGFERLTEGGARGWSRIRVPGDWTMQGFSVKPWTPAGYLKTVSLPADWSGARILLRCDAAQSDAKFWVNGRPAGAHEGGFTAFELDVTGLCRPGAANTIAAAVQNESTADVLASGTQYAAYQFGGITRKIYLMAVPPVGLADFDVTTDLDERYKDAVLSVGVAVKNGGRGTSPPLRLEMRLLGPDGVEVLRKDRTMETLRPGETRPVAMNADVPAPLLWDAEHPNLYNLALELYAGRALLERTSRRIGFREVEAAGTRVFVNGRPVRIRGINRHETHPLLGRSLTPELWRADAELFRAANINSIRTSHYPPAEEFLDACDELGLFVECESALVWINHGANDFWKANDPLDARFRPLILRAVAENIAFNRNHPSILFWSLANESGWSPHFAAANDMARRMDPTRPRTFHDQAYGGYNNLGSTAMPVANYHYPGPQGPEVALGFARPLLYGEYCHLNTYNRTEIAADPGVRDEYGRGLERMVERMAGSAAVIGGAIWSGIDDVFLLPSGKAVGYGEWGPIDGWRREKPEYWHIKKAYSPVKIRPDRLPAPAPGAPIVLQVENRHDFTDLAECEIRWQIGNEAGRAPLSLAPRSSGILKIRPGASDLDGRTLRIRVAGPRGVPLDAYEIALGDRRPEPPPFLSPPPGPVRLESGTETLKVTGRGFSWTIDRTSGAILGAEVDGIQVVSGGPALMLLPQTTGPCVTDFSLDVPPLNDVCADWTASGVEARLEDGAVVVTVRGRYAEASGGFAIRLDGAGRAAFTYDFQSAAKLNPRQHGLVLYLPRAYDTLDWLRRGQWSVYPENHIGRPRGTARASAPDRAFRFGVRPAWDWKDDQNALGSNDFRSTKTGLEWAALSAAGGRGLLVLSDGAPAARAFLDGDRVGWLIAGFTTGGGDLFFASHHKLDDRPLEAGDPVRGSFTVQIASGKRRPPNGLCDCVRNVPD
jgi:hypothetical protein